jgi:CRP/FNR family transcriptional regulator, anaerobic regulatory protein
MNTEANKKDEPDRPYDHSIPTAEKALDNFCALYREEIPYVDELVQKIAAHGKIKTYKTGDSILPLGSPSDHVSILLHGLVRRYTLAADGREITILFHRAGTIFDQVRFINQGIGGCFGLDVLKPAMTIAIPAPLIKKFAEADPRMYKLFYTNLARRLVARFERDTMLLSANCYDRYKDFIKNYPDVAGSAKSIHIASYLGMSLENMSRIRTKLKNSSI